MVVVLDACVLYSSTLRNLLMWLASRRLYQAHWTDAIHEEWVNHLLENRPDLEPTKIQRTRRFMDNIHPECLVRNYERQLSRFTLPDAGDAHVLAAAIEGEANYIVTFNLVDFPSHCLEPFGIQALHPEPFLREIFQRNPDAFLATVKTHRASLKNPPQSVEEYLLSLQRCGLSAVVDLLNKHYEEI